MHKAILDIHDEKGILYECILPEVHKQSRSEYTVKKTKEGCEFSIKAADGVAFRATLNSITKLVAVYERCRILHNGKGNPGANKRVAAN